MKIASEIFSPLKNAKFHSHYYDPNYSIQKWQSHIILRAHFFLIDIFW